MAKRYQSVQCGQFPLVKVGLRFSSFASPALTFSRENCAAANIEYAYDSLKPLCIKTQADMRHGSHTAGDHGED